MDEWRTNKKTGKPFRVKSKPGSGDSGDMFPTHYGWVDTRTRTEYASDTEIVQARREDIAEQKKQAQIQQSAQEAEEAQRQNERPKKPRRKAIGKYTYGDTYEQDGKKYEVRGINYTSPNSGKVAGWYVWDSEKECLRYVDKFEGLQD